MDLHGGSISVFSAGEGRGTTFSVKLPVYREARLKSTSSERQAYLTASFVRPQEWARQSLHLMQRVLSYESVYNAAGNKGNATTGDNNTLQSTKAKQGSNSLIARNRVKASDSMEQAPVPSARVAHYDSVDIEYHDEKDSESQTKHTSNTFLIVDDVPLTRKMMRRLLSDRSNAIDEAIDGEQAVEMVRVSIIQDKPYDVVMMDNQMPMMDGPTAAQAMRQLGFTGLILGVTGHTSSEDEEQFLSKGADKVLTKPIDLKELDRIIAGELPTTTTTMEHVRILLINIFLFFLSHNSSFVESSTSTTKRSQQAHESEE